MPDLLEIIAGCKKMEKRAQRCLYDMYAPLFLGIAFRYSKSKEDAEDILQESFVKILTKINQYNETGSFEGWMKRIVVNTAISHYRTSQKHDFHKDFDNIFETNIENYELNDDEFNREELLSCINKLPPGFKMIFNMYAIEGYKHREIAEMLDISIGTSKSQYSRARVILQNNLNALKFDKTRENKISEK
ncbi:MAG: RNA polymerase sigma factor [Bacteroidales bacterium]|nr:RNA polymerase sigma factor [Bacteroidales bacterium]